MSLENSEATNRQPARRVLDDPVVLRAFAHPLRLALHRLLIREGLAAAAYAARDSAQAKRRRVRSGMRSPMRRARIS